jgi:hypothetical protein
VAVVYVGEEVLKRKTYQKAKRFGAKLLKAFITIQTSFKEGKMIMAKLLEEEIASSRSLATNTGGISLKIFALSQRPFAFCSFCKSWLVSLRLHANSFQKSPSR